MSKNSLVSLLLAFCIGLLPVLDAVAASASHMLTMPVDCPDCGPPDADRGDSCAQDECLSMISACGSQAGSGFPGAGFSLRMNPLAQESPAGRSSPRYRPDLDDSLYRPPIG